MKAPWCGTAYHIGSAASTLGLGQPYLPTQMVPTAQVQVEELVKKVSAVLPRHLQSQHGEAGR